MDTDLTLKDLLNRAYNDTPFDIKLRLQAADTHSEILIQVERAVSFAIDQLVRNRKYKQGFSEDQKTVEIASIMQGIGVPAVHDAKIGGHTDLSVEMRDGFLWLAEAKNWAGCAWTFKGFRQLMTRYATGLPAQDNGAIIIYFEQERAASLLQRWRSQLSRLGAVTRNATEVADLAFRSCHIHRGTDRPFYIKHLAVPLYWNPEDG